MLPLRFHSSSFQSFALTTQASEKKKLFQKNPFLKRTVTSYKWDIRRTGYQTIWFPFSRMLCTYFFHLVLFAYRPVWFPPPTSPDRQEQGLLQTYINDNESTHRLHADYLQKIIKSGLKLEEFFAFFTSTAKYCTRRIIGMEWKLQDCGK